MAKSNQKAYPHPVFSSFLRSNEIKAFISKTINPNSKIFVICDSNTDKNCFPLLIEKLKDAFLFNKITISEGENNKNLDTCRNIWGFLVKNEAKKDSLIINLGGGVVTDIGGFCASLYMRGIPFIHIPTSLMAMVDASLGGKTGIDSEMLKNNIGNISFPKAVFIDSSFLETLPKREFNAGFYEMIKHGLIADKFYFYDLVGGKYTGNIDSAIEISVKIKMKIVLEDPYENSERKLLNFGHTIGHAIESSYLKYSGKSLLHGEAVLFGMIAESFISLNNGLLKKQDFDEIIYLLKPLMPNIKMHNDNIEDIFYFLMHDKKHSSSQLNFTLLKETGNAIINQNVDKQTIKQSLVYLSELTKGN
ncbi:MAG: 3-dehydroquinate synthase [Bacteroidota bacterium]